MHVLVVLPLELTDVPLEPLVLQLADLPKICALVELPPVPPDALPDQQPPQHADLPKMYALPVLPSEPTDALPLLVDSPKESALAELP